MLSSTRKGEQTVSAEMVVSIAKEQGIYLAFQFWYDCGRHSQEEITEFLELLKNTKGAINKGILN